VEIAVCNWARQPDMALEVAHWYAARFWLKPPIPQEGIFRLTNAETQNAFWLVSKISHGG